MPGVDMWESAPARKLLTILFSTISAYAFFNFVPQQVTRAAGSQTLLAVMRTMAGSLMAPARRAHSTTTTTQGTMSQSMLAVLLMADAASECAPPFKT